MQEGKFSRTARRVAMRRAAHQICDEPKVLDDPLALRILPPETIEELRTKSGEDNRFSRTMRAFMSMRSRFAEDELASAIELGVRQYVILGAGLDTSAFRPLCANSNLRVFEVDHPATQAWKRERIAAGEIPIPSNLSFVPVDFECQNLADELKNSGFQAVPTFFSWLGVTPYLTREAFNRTLNFIASLPAPTGIVLDYAVDAAVLSLFERVALQALAARVAAAGEPFQLFFIPAELDRELRSLGFNAIQNLDRDAMNARYFKNRADGLQIAAGLGRILSARRG